jgi:hypothetical protein
VVCSSGPAEQRLPELAHWHSALMDGALPDPGHTFGDAAATQALRPCWPSWTCSPSRATAHRSPGQVLQSLLWHLDSLIDRPDSEPRAAAIDRMAGQFRESWDVQRQGWDEALALLQVAG